MSKNKCFFQVRISHILLLSICDLFIDFPSYIFRFEAVVYTNSGKTTNLVLQQFTNLEMA
jgi:hypothetical protein